MGSTAERSPVGRRASIRVEDHLEADGHIALPAGVNLISLLDDNIAAFGDRLAYRYLDYTRSVEGRSVELTWSQLVSEPTPSPRACSSRGPR